MTSRRNLLQAMALLPAINACSVAAPSQAPTSINYTPSGSPLRRVNINQSRVIRTVTGLRPYRRQGFVVNSQQLGDKTLIHNYGHGGGGITLSWGTSHLAMRMALTTIHKQCAVLGCGVMGLTTARLMQDQGWDVTIYAKALPPYTTSNIAGGQWSPASVYEEGYLTPQFKQQFDEAMALSYRYYQDLVGPKYGVKWISNYQFSNTPRPTDDLVHNYQSMYPQLKDLGPSQHPFPIAYASHYDTMLIEPATFLTALMQDFYGAGGRIEVKQFSEEAEIQLLAQPVVFNCTGLGARDLFGDEKLFPIKGQLSFVLPQKEVDYITITDDTYMFPRSDGILLGGTFEYNNWDLTPDPAETVRILRQHQAFFAGMQDPWNTV